MNSGIYIIKNMVNGKVYVGSTYFLKNRWSNHKSELKLNKHHSIKLQRSVNKYGIENFEFIPIQYCEVALLIENEQFWIDFFDSYKNGYNCTPKAGSTTGKITSEETKEKLRIASSGNKYRLGILHTEETKKRMSESRKGNKNRLGKSHSEEIKKKISDGGKGRVVSNETKEKIRKANIGRNHTEESKQKIKDSWIIRKQKLKNNNNENR